jgi:type II secretory pathway pseudopilin PulG
MQLALRPKPFKRTAVAMLIILIAAAGVAFAFLQSQAKLTGNSIQTQTAGLLISQNDANYSASASGYSFAGIIPGSQPSQTEHFMLKNTGSAQMALKLGVAGPFTNPSDVDLSKVHVILTPYSTVTSMPGTPQDFTLQSLVDAGPSGAAVNYPGSLSAGSKEEFNLQISMDADAVNASGASLANLDLVFTAIANGPNN